MQPGKSKGNGADRSRGEAASRPPSSSPRRRGSRRAGLATDSQRWRLWIPARERRSVAGRRAMLPNAMSYTGRCKVHDTHAPPHSPDRPIGNLRQHYCRKLPSHHQRWRKGRSISQVSTVKRQSLMSASAPTRSASLHNPQLPQHSRQHRPRVIPARGLAGTSPAAAPISNGTPVPRSPGRTPPRRVSPPHRHRIRSPRRCRRAGSFPAWSC